MSAEALAAIRTTLSEGRLIPYLGPGTLALAGDNLPLPAGPDPLVAKLTAKATVPHKIRKNCRPPRNISRTSSTGKRSARS